jgi:dTDP-4-amino-4,6-dideoxygalactose transaminase
MARGTPVESRLSVPLADVLVDDEIVDAVSEAVKSGWWSMGPRVAEFERAFADFCGARHALAVSSGTAALHLALVATGSRPGDEIIMPSLNFVAAANVVCHTGAVPVFCDIRGPHDLNLDPDDLEAVVTPRTKGILVLHYGGFPCDMDAVLEIAERHRLIVIEDAAHAPGAIWRDRACGTLGAVGCFSFFANKNLPVGEGGMVVTNDDDLAARVRLLRSHGMTALTWDRDRGHAHAYDVVAPGFNYRMDEFRAAVALVQLERLTDANLSRARLAERYRSLLDGVNGVLMPFGRRADGASAAHHLAVVLLPPGIRRDAVREALHEQGIQTSVHYPPIHGFSFYAEAFSDRRLRRTEEVAERILTLPLYAHMAEDDVDRVVGALSQAVVDCSIRERASRGPSSTG